MSTNKVIFTIFVFLMTQAYPLDSTSEDSIKNHENLVVAKMHLKEADQRSLKGSVEQLIDFDDKVVFLEELSRLSAHKNFDGFSKESFEAFRKLGRPYWAEVVTKALQFFDDETLYANTFFYFCKSYKIIAHKNQILPIGKDLCSHLNIKDNLEQALFLQSLTAVKEKNPKKFESQVIHALKDQETL